MSGTFAEINFEFCKFISSFALKMNGLHVNVILQKVFAAFFSFIVSSHPFMPHIKINEVIVLLDVALVTSKNRIHNLRQSFRQEGVAPEQKRGLRKRFPAHIMSK